MTLRMGIIGLSPGNGHPYSWAAICNGYDPEAMAECGFPAIPEYLARQSWPGDRLDGAQVTHVWTQDEAESRRLARASRIDTVTRRPEDMIGEIDALLLARDDAQNHLRFAEPFLRAGLPVYIDKPVALSEARFDALNALQQRPGQIFSCSALRFAPELRLEAAAASRIGPIRLIQGVTPKYWETYAIHLIDPLLTILGHEAQPERLFAGPVGANGRLLGLRWPDAGADVHLMATGSLPSPLHLRIIGETGAIVLTFHDSFTAFKTALAEFVASVNEGRSRLPEDFNRRAVQIIEMGPAMTKTVVITGATGKLGAVIARHLAALGWHLVLTSRDAARCEPLAQELRAAGATVHAVALDLLDEDSTETLAARIADKGIAVTHVVSNARSLDTLKMDEAGLAPAKKFLDEFAIDVVAPYRMLMAFVRDPRHDLRGVVTVGSQYGEVAPNPALYDGDLSRSPVQYGVAKAALHHMTRELSVRLAPGVRVNCVAYGGFVGRTDSAFQERYARLAPLGRMLTEADAGGPVAFLLDDAAAAAVTGHVLVADGGWSVW